MTVQVALEPQSAVAVTVQSCSLVQVPVMAPPTAPRVKLGSQLSLTLPAAAMAAAAVGSVAGLQPKSTALAGQLAKTGAAVSSVQV